jgi:hypothetical protein
LGDQAVCQDPDAVSDPIRVSEDRGRGNSLDSHALARQPRIAAFVVRHLVVAAMNSAVNFYGKRGGGAEEVQDVRPFSVLPPPYRHSRKAVSQAKPEQAFRLGHLATQRAGAFGSEYRGSHAGAARSARHWRNWRV